MITALRPHHFLRRHDLLRVRPDCWPRIRTRASAGAGVLQAWVSHHWPVIVRRYQQHETRDLIPVAIPLPPSRPGQRAGVALQLRADELAADGRAFCLPLSAGLPQAPRTWHPTMRALMQLSDRLGSHAALYGSLLWQTLTGRIYLTASSDLDVRWQVAEVRQARALVRGLSILDRDSPMRLDGELLLPDGAGVSWREFAGGGDEVLLKTLHALEWRARARLFAPGGDRARTRFA